MVYRALVPVIILAHFAFLAYVVFGGLLTWRWPSAFWPHLVATLWGVLLIAFSLNCPLTAAERWARRHAGRGERRFSVRDIEDMPLLRRWGAISAQWVPNDRLICDSGGCRTVVERLVARRCSPRRSGSLDRQRADGARRS